MRTILTIGGDTWTDISSSPNDTQVWKITDKGYKEVEDGLKPTMLDDEDIIDLVDLGVDEIHRIFQTNSLDEHMQSTNNEEASSE
tara:strand:+ start:374 stop:628 length:255 start_codon:yes stop_codon:yes gene_type:complete